MALILRCVSASRRLTSGAMTTLTCSPRAADQEGSLFVRAVNRMAGATSFVPVSQSFRSELARRRP
jgi:hypothetical protein